MNKYLSANGDGWKIDLLDGKASCGHCRQDQVVLPVDVSLIKNAELMTIKIRHFKIIIEFIREPGQKSWWG